MTTEAFKHLLTFQAFQKFIKEENNSHIEKTGVVKMAAASMVINNVVDFDYAME